MGDENELVQCDVHGEMSATFVCHHLSNGEQLGFHMGFDPDAQDELYPDAWCDECDEILEKEGEWNESSAAFADIKVLCAGCYCEVRERNWVEDNDAFNDLVRDGHEYLQNIQESFLQEYRINDYERWDWSQETGKLIFSHEGQAFLECDIHFVGTVSTLSNTWMWAWANATFTDSIKDSSRIVREIGDERNFLKLACALWDADEIAGWEMTAVMAKTIGAIGAYRTSSNDGFVYMLVTKVNKLKHRS